MPYSGMPLNHRPHSHQVDIGLVHLAGLFGIRFFTQQCFASLVHVVQQGTFLRFLYQTLYPADSHKAFPAADLGNPVWLDDG